MNSSNPYENLALPIDDGACDHLLNIKIPDISLPNQNGIFLKLNRTDTFRLVIYCFSRTGHPERSLPKDWESIPGAKGCTIQNCTFRDNYEELILLNSLPIGLSSQSVDDLNEMTKRLKIPYDVLSDQNLTFVKSLSLPTFSISNDTYIKRLTLIIEKSKIKKVFYPIFSPNKHIQDVINYLKEN